MPAFEAARNRADAGALSSDDGSRRQAVIDLADLLGRRKMSAVGRFSFLAPQLRQFLDKEAFEVVRNHMDRLRFAEAAGALRNVLAREAETIAA